MRMRSLCVKLYHSAWGRILLSAMLVAAAFTVFSFVQQITFLTNDDSAIVFTLAGYHTGVPSPYALFINALLGYAVSGLYALLPGVPWWAVLQIAVLYASCTAVGCALLREGARRDAPMLVPLALFGALLVTLILQPLIELTYTVTAAVAGAAGAALVLTATEEERGFQRVLLDALGAAFAVIAFLYREETGYAVLCFFAAACVYRVLHALLSDGAERRRAIRGVCALLAAVLAICAGAFAFNRAMHMRVNGAEYETFFRYRERFTDYPRPTYAEAPALYDAAGWDEPLFHLAEYWCFLDERIDADALKTITDAQVVQIPLAEAVETFVTTVDEDVSLRLIAALLLLTVAAGLYGWLRDRARRWDAFAVQCAVTLGAALLCVFLCMRGRFLPRTFRVAAIPAVVTSCVLAMRMYAPRDRGGRGALIVFAALSGAVALASGLITARELRVNSPKHLLADSRAVYAYVLAHPENVYVRDTFVISDVDAFAVYPDEKPTNLLSWGGCEMRSAESARQLAINGINTRYADLFQQENVYFVTRTGSSEEAVLLTYLTSAWNATGFEAVDAITDAIAVYRVTY